MAAPFGHVLTAMITPFDGSGAVDFGRVDELARHLVDTGSDGLVVAGTTGESPTLSDDEKVAVFRTVVDAVGGKATVVAGTGSNDTAHSVELTQAAAEAGCDAVMAVTPYYNRPPQAGLIRHFTAIADATDRPVLLYNIPSRTGRLIEIDTLTELGRHSGIVAVKDAVGDLGFTADTRAALGPDFGIYSGDDILTLPILSVGGDGIVSVAAHLVGRQIKRMVEAYHAGDSATAGCLHLALTPLCRALFLEPNPMPVKGAMNRWWSSVGDPRLPLVAASEETLAAVERALVIAQQA